MSREINIKMHFFEDYINILKTRLTTDGFQIDSSMDDHDLCMRYFSYQRRKIGKSPRNILTSREFSYPPDVQDGLDLVKNKIQQGLDLTPHLHLEISDLNYNDMLLNDWGIHHLHLGTKPHPTRPEFVRRTGPVLFAKFDRVNAYLLTVMDHSPGHNPWINKILIQIIHGNWPELIAKYQLQGIKQAKSYSEQEHGQFRSAGINVILEMDDGTNYIPIGGGYAGSKVSIQVVRICDLYAGILRDCEEIIGNNINYIVEECKQRGIELGDDLEFRLEVINDQLINSELNFSAVEVKSEIKIQLTITELNNQYRANLRSLSFPIRNIKS